jgi:hypothetical protein
VGRITGERDRGGLPYDRVAANDRVKAGDRGSGRRYAGNLSAAAYVGGIGENN